MLDIEEYSKKMKNAELFQGMGFNRILEFKEDVVKELHSHNLSENLHFR